MAIEFRRLDVGSLLEGATLETATISMRGTKLVPADAEQTELDSTMSMTMRMVAVLPTPEGVEARMEIERSQDLHRERLD